MRTKSSKVRKQRKAQITAPFHLKVKRIRSPLDPKRYANVGVKTVSLRKGDTVKVVRGSRAGHEGKVASIDLRSGKVSIEKALLRKADNKEVSLWFDPSNLVVTKLDLSDAGRKEKFKNVSEE